MIGSRYRSTGITVRYKPCHGHPSGQWGASLNFFDDGSLDDGPGGISTQGMLATRYFVSPRRGFADEVATLAAVLDTLVADATGLGVAFVKPCLSVPGGGEYTTTTYHPQWRELLAAQATRLGWETPYEGVAQ